jgi:hypothetical protein
VLSASTNKLAKLKENVAEYSDLIMEFEELMALWADSRAKTLMNILSTSGY